MIILHHFGYKMQNKSRDRVLLPLHFVTKFNNSLMNHIEHITIMIFEIVDIHTKTIALYIFIEKSQH